MMYDVGAGTLTAGVLAGGASVLATTPGKVIATLEATYNIGVGAAYVLRWQSDQIAHSLFYPSSFIVVFVASVIYG